MKQVLSKNQAQNLDKITSEYFHIQGKELMRNAGKKVAEVVQKEFSKKNNKSVLIICGKGNNGGDGFSTAIELKKKLIDIHIHSLYDKKQYIGDSKYYLDLCISNKIPITFGIEIGDNDYNHSIIVDAILGIGFRGSIKTGLIPWIKFINKSKSTIISIDIPTGLNADSGLACPIAVKSSITVTMGYEKIGMSFQKGPEYCGKIKRVDIGFPKGALNSIDNLKWFKFDEKSVSKYINKPDLNTNKFKQGRVLIVGGSIGMTGAASLCAMGALRVGAGLTSIVAPMSLNFIFETKLTEAITIPVDDEEKGFLFLNHLDQIIENSERADAIVIGPGLGRNKSTKKLIMQLMLELEKPVVLDADGLYPFNGKLDLLNNSKLDLVITPHFAEMARLTDSSYNQISNEFPRFMNWFMDTYKHSALIKQVPACSFSYNTAIINISGNPGLATAGTGDILSGMIGGLLAMGINKENAVPLAAFLHGKASDRIINSKGFRAQIASDILEQIPFVIGKYERI